MSVLSADLTVSWVVLLLITILSTDSSRAPCETQTLSRLLCVADDCDSEAEDPDEDDEELDSLHMLHLLHFVLLFLNNGLECSPTSYIT